MPTTVASKLHNNQTDPSVDIFFEKVGNVVEQSKSRGQKILQKGLGLRLGEGRETYVIRSEAPSFEPVSLAS